MVKLQSALYILEYDKWLTLSVKDVSRQISLSRTINGASILGRPNALHFLQSDVCSTLYVLKASVLVATDEISSVIKPSCPAVEPLLGYRYIMHMAELSVGSFSVAQATLYKTIGPYIISGTVAWYAETLLA